MSESILRVLHGRAAGLNAIRRILSDAGAVEVVTPIASTYPDLAPVPQLKALHPASGTEFSLRIAPEEHLTRLIARGVPAVFEVSTNFRAEVLDATHLIEFQSVEAIFARRTTAEMRGIAEAVCRGVEEDVRAVAAVKGPRWCPPMAFETVHLPAWVRERTGCAPEDFATPEGLLRILRKLSREPAPGLSRDALADEVIGAVASEIARPAFVTSLPDYLGGPARPCPVHPGFLDRSELYVGGLELGSLADQVTDMAILRTRYDLNARLRRERGLAAAVNEPCLADYARGLPAYCGLGLGIDRLLILSLGINDVRALHPFLYE